MELGTYMSLGNNSNSVITAVGWEGHSWLQNAGFPVLVAKLFSVPSLAWRL